MTNHEQELAAEQARVDQIQEEIARQVAAGEIALEAAHQETRAVEQNYGENASINRAEIDDIAESRSELEQQRQLVARATENEAILKHQLATLKRLKGQPYFGRIDLQVPGQAAIQRLYIGTASLMNADRTKFLIHDWRAPISGVYYNGTLGPVTYETPAGPRRVTLVKKHQFTIIDGKITNMFDTNEAVGDQLLQAALGQQNDQQMQSIVATIQHEQNDIIRNTSADLLVVQGVAGSGKTSAILQRIAYLLYHARESLNADQILLFSPNLLFSHYIASVLPSLGERNMRQVTLPGFLNRRYEGLVIESLFDRYESRPRNAAPAPVADFLEGAEGMTAVQDFVAAIRQGRQALKFVDLLFEGTPLITAGEVAKIFAATPAKLPLPDRLVKTKNALIRRLQRRARQEAKRDWVAKELDALDTQQLYSLYGQHSPDDFEDEATQVAYLSRRLAKRRLRVVADAIYNNFFLDLPALYQAFLLTTPLSPDQRKQAVADFGRELEFHRVALMHTAPFLYLRDLVIGGGQNRSFQYVFVDEMQDYPLATLIYLHHAFPAARFTLLGDSEQALFRPLEAPQSLLTRVSSALAAKRPHLVTLNKSYRSTFEITNFAKGLLPDGDLIQAFTRHGERPRLIMTNPGQHAATLAATVTALQRHAPTVAVLTTTARAAETVSHQLRSHAIANHRLQPKDASLPSGVLVLPVYLAKGLEFDAVVIADLAPVSQDPANTGIVYTMASRAMHQLVMLASGPVGPVVTPAAGQWLTIEHQSQ